MKKRKHLKKILSKAVPLWMVILITLNITLVGNLLQYYLMKKELNSVITKLAQTTKSPDELVQILKQEVLPQKGYMTSIRWKDLGKQLVEAEAIDKEKYKALFAQEADGGDHMKYLEGSSEEQMIINEKNSRFMVNTLWALGLVNKSAVLEGPPMKQEGMDTANMASTGGWTLGSKQPMELYASAEIIPLTPEQQELVKKIAANVYRPCCNNNTAFPDCNHGMAALGYIQLAVKNNLSEKQIYKDLLAFNSFWFPQAYVEIGVFFDKQGTRWKDADAKVILSANYSSATGAQKIQQSVQGVPGIQSQGGGCAA